MYQLNKKTVEYFLYDGQKEIGSLNEDFQLKEFRLLGETLHAELGSAVAIELDGKIFLPLHDLQSNLATLVSLDGSAVFEADYSAFGEQAVSGSEISPWGFSSKRQYRNLDLVYYGRRFYVPTLGRWLTPDPSGFTDGINLYTFVGNEPLMHFDEYGLWLQPRPPGSFHSPEFVRSGLHAIEQFSTGFNRGAMNVGFGAARLANTMIHGVASPFHCFNLQNKCFDFSMGSSFTQSIDGLVIKSNAQIPFCFQEEIRIT